MDAIGELSEFVEAGWLSWCNNTKSKSCEDRGEIPAETTRTGKRQDDRIKRRILLAAVNHRQSIIVAKRKVRNCAVGYELSGGIAFVKECSHKAC